MIFVNDYSNMSTEIRLKRGTGIPSSLKEGEPAIDKTPGDLYVGLSDGTVKKVNSTDLSDIIKKGEGNKSVILNDKDNVASKDHSLAEGYATQARGDYAHAEGASTVADGNNSHSEGAITAASGESSHAEGNSTIASGEDSHAEGFNTKAIGFASHAEGFMSKAVGASSHSEGGNTTASGEDSHTEGYHSITGRKAYRIASVDSENKKYGLDIVIGISIDDILSGYNKTNGIENNFGKVTAIDTTNKTITVDVMGTVVIGDYLFTDDVTVGDTYILGEKAHAEGDSSYAIGENSHSEGNSTRAVGDNSHSEGWLSKASGKSAHAEGYNSKATSTATHAEGDATEASGNSSHSEGSQTKAIGDVSHAEGMMTKAIGGGSHAEGGSTEAVGNNSHAEGTSSQSLGVHSHAEGLQSIAGGTASHAEGNITQAGRKAFKVIALDSANKKYTLNTVEGLKVNDSLNCYYFADDDYRIKNNFGKITAIDTTNKIITVDKFYSTNGTLPYLFTEDITKGDVYIFDNGHAEGYKTVAGANAHSEGDTTLALGKNAHSEGSNTTASGKSSHAEGNYTTASGINSHVEGSYTTASGINSHAEGNITEASGGDSHAEGSYTTAEGSCSHAEGSHTTARGYNSHAEGYNTIASGDYQHVQGKNNIVDTANKYADIIGNGEDEGILSNAYTLDWQGNGWFSGDIKIGGVTYDDPDAKEIATKEYVDSKAGGESSEAQYKTVALNEVVSEAANGLTKFSITGLAVSAIHNPSHGNVLKKYVPLQHTKGTLNIVRNETNISSFDVDLYGRNANNTYGFSEAKDEINEMGYKRVWSNDFFITDAFDYTIETPENNSANRLHTFTIPASAFGDELPKKTGVIEPLCSFAQACSIEHMNSITDNVVSQYGKGYYIAMQYSSENNNYKVMFLTNAINKSKLLATKMFIRYELETPVYDKHINKIYIKNGDKFTFDQVSVESFTTNNSTPGIAQVPITIDIKVPCNNKAVLDGFEQTTENINDLNKRIDNVEVNNTKIGSADGVTDDSDAIQKLIDSALDGTTGHVKEVVIPDGEYALGKSIELTTSNIRLTGNGNVILKPTGRFPAIKIYRPSDTAVSDVQVDNITIYLPNTINSDSDDGLHSGIYVDGNNRGMYRVVLKNISIQGVYRYEIRDTDKSYGIYFKDVNTETESTNNGFVYFPTIENCSAFSVMCGLYLGVKNNGSNVVDFHWDHGKNIYNVAGPLWSLFGVKYGIVCRSNLNTITFRGQAFGDNTLGLIYYDASNGTKYTLKEIVGENNCYTDTYGRDFFNEGYEVTTALKHNNNIVYLRYDNLTMANILCSGNTNFIQGQAYDPQRADNYIYFEKGSSYNRYYYPVNYMEFGTSQISTSNNCEVYGKGKGTIYMPMYREENLDFGFNNVAINQPLESQQESFVGDVYKYSPSSVGISKHFGMQDNALGYVDKWCNVSVYQKNSEGEKVAVTVNNGVSATAAIGALFDPKSVTYGFDKGITFDAIPSLDNPIYIDIESDNVILSRWSRFILQFNENICQDFEIHSRILGSDWQTVNLGKATRNNTKAFYSRHLYDSARTGFQTYDNVTGIRIILNQAYSTDSYNTEKKVGLCLIYATDSNHGGNTWLPKGGGNLYGDIDLNNNKITGINTLEIKSSTTDSTNTFEVSIDDTGIITTKNGDMVKKVAEKVDSVDKTTETTISITALADNSQLVYGSVNSINVGFPEILSFDYMASISFTTPSTIGETYSTFPSDLYFRGDESEGGIFIPNPSTRYTMLFYCDGVRKIGLVSGIEVSST